MCDKLFHGVYAALLSPRLDDGSIDLPSLRSLVSFLRDRGVTRFAVNGATGEFCLTNPNELRELLSTVQAEAGPGAEILCGVGTASLAGSRSLVRVAEEARVQGLLLSMPYFFPYSKGDLYEFSKAVAESTSLPVLLYNLPQFTSGLEVDTVCRLIEEVPAILGIKDSSGSLDILTALSERLPQACRIVGNDSALAPALQQGICDGVVSGVACVLPELILRIFHSGCEGTAFHAMSEELALFIDRLNVFPTPWGLKVAAQARGLLQARFSLPPSDERNRQACAFEEWVQDRLPKMLATM